MMYSKLQVLLTGVSCGWYTPRRLIWGIKGKCHYETMESPMAEFLWYNLLLLHQGSISWAFRIELVVKAEPRLNPL